MADLMSLRSAWESFYVIVGSCGAALIGVQFVVIALVANRRSLASAEAIHAFSTPNVVHLSAALLVSAILSAPWPSLWPASVALGLTGLGGLVYGMVVVRRAHRQTAYAPVWQDWIWYAMAPCSLYAALALAALFLGTASQVPLFVIAGTALGLLLLGIRNAWDTVTHLVVQGSNESE
jgi:hypothetical protein